MAYPNLSNNLTFSAFFRASIGGCATIALSGCASMALSGCVGIALSGCATSISVTDKYRALEGDAKILFLDVYPDLTPEEKAQSLENPEHLRSLRLSHYSKSSVLPQFRKPLSLKIKPFPSAAITEGTFIDLRAYVNYSDGKHIDVTPDTTWSAMPSIVKLNANQLQYECLSSDISIYASFLDEVNVTQILSFKKPIKNITVQVAESSSIIDDSAFIKLNSNAICQDGTMTEVSCQSIWTADPQWGTFQGCGHLHPSAKSWKEGSAIVSFSYGALTFTQLIYLPARVRRR